MRKSFKIMPFAPWVLAGNGKRFGMTSLRKCVYASTCLHEALSYMSFCMQMLGKSFRMMPIMVWGSNWRVLRSHITISFSIVYASTCRHKALDYVGLPGQASSGLPASVVL